MRIVWNVLADVVVVEAHRWITHRSGVERQRLPCQVEQADRGILWIDRRRRVRGLDDAVRHREVRIMLHRQADLSGVHDMNGERLREALDQYEPPNGDLQGWRRSRGILAPRTQPLAG